MNTEQKRTAAIAAIKTHRELIDGWWEGTGPQQQRLDQRIQAAEGVILNMVMGWFPDTENENAALRNDRVKLQDENLTLRADHDVAIRDLRELVLKIERDWFERTKEMEKSIGEAIEEIRRLTLVPAVGGDGSSLGERLAEIEKRLGKTEKDHANSVYFANRRMDSLDKRLIAQVPFPTGAATTIDEVLAAVPAEPETQQDDGPPRRGDRVRLEGALTTYLRKPIPNGWYDVLGRDHNRVQNDEFQIAADDKGWVPFIRDHDKGLMEVRRGAAQLDD